MQPALCRRHDGRRHDGRWEDGGPPCVANVAAFPVLKVRVDRAGGGSFTPPEGLSSFERYRVEEAVNANTPRSFRLSMRRMIWTINGRIFEMEGVAEDEIVRLNTLEVWEFVNQDDFMNMIHPMHIHNVQFQVIEREVLPELSDEWETVRGGYLDEGWKDTILLMPGERVKLLVKFEDYTGLSVEYTSGEATEIDEGLQYIY